MPILVLIKDPTCSACTIRGSAVAREKVDSLPQCHISKVKINISQKNAQNKKITVLVL